MLRVPVSCEIKLDIKKQTLLKDLKSTFNFQLLYLVSLDKGAIMTFISFSKFYISSKKKKQHHSIITELKLYAHP